RVAADVPIGHVLTNSVLARLPPIVAVARLAAEARTIAAIPVGAKETHCAGIARVGVAGRSLFAGPGVSRPRRARKQENRSGDAPGRASFRERDGPVGGAAQGGSHGTRLPHSNIPIAPEPRFAMA